MPKLPAQSDPANRVEPGGTGLEHLAEESRQTFGQAIADAVERYVYVRLCGPGGYSVPPLATAELQGRHEHLHIDSDKTMISFNTGIPDFDSMILAEGLGLCQLRRFYEDGDVLLYMGGNRMFRVAGSTRWRYAKYPSR